MLKIGMRKIPYAKLFGWWVITVWLSLFMATASEAQTTNSVAPPGPNLVSAAASVTTATSPPATDDAKPQVVACGWLCFLIVIAIIVGILAWVFVSICKALKKLFGNRGNEPPESPGNNGNIVHSNISGNQKGIAANGLEYASFAVSPKGSLTSTDTNTTMSAVQAVFAQLFVVPATSETGFPSGVGMWQYTGSMYDANFGINYQGALIYNFSVQSSTDLAHWRTRCTVVGWIAPTTQIPPVPWVCQVVYTNSVTVTGGVSVTNGIPVSTNWVTAQINPMTLAPTNIVAYGSLTPIINPATTPKEFYRLVCTSDTNADLTIGP